MLESEKIAFQLIREFLSIMEESLNHDVHTYEHHSHSFLGKNQSDLTSETRLRESRALSIRDRGLAILKELDEIMGAIGT